MTAETRSRAHTAGPGDGEGLSATARGQFRADGTEGPAGPGATAGAERSAKDIAITVHHPAILEDVLAANDPDWGRGLAAIGDFRELVDLGAGHGRATFRRTDPSTASVPETSAYPS